MNTEIIKLYDNENYEYPFIEIEKGFLEEFKKDLKEYRKNLEYNFEDFIFIIEKKSYFIRSINYDWSVFF